MKRKDLEKMNKEELITLLLANNKYGLNWEKENINTTESIAKDCEKKYPLLSRIKSKGIDKGDINNILVEGDNYHALKSMQFTHRNKVDIIYIDPPYNTGAEDFMYNDKYVDEDDTFKHSKWLNFMEKRLILAKSLLSEQGLIGISINDEELYNLKLLSDKVFGESNFLYNIVIEAKKSGLSGSLINSNEYLLVYARDKKVLKLTASYKKVKIIDYYQDYILQGKSWKFTSIITSRGKRKLFLNDKENNRKIYTYPELQFESVKKFAKDNNLKDEEVLEKYKDDIFRTTNSQSSIRKYVADNSCEIETYVSIEYIPQKGKNKGQMTEVFYDSLQHRNQLIFLSDQTDENGMYNIRRTTLWNDIEYNNVTKEGNVVYKNGKKPIKLIENFLSLSPIENATVLDFFAGSGSTGHAVVSMNKKDGQKRKFILVQKKFDNTNNIIGDVTYQRIKNILDDENLIYLKTNLVSKKTNDISNKRAVITKVNDIICLKEDKFIEVYSSDEYSFYSNKSNEVIGIYNSPYSDSINKFIKDAIINDASKIYYYNSEHFKDMLSVLNVAMEEIPVELMNALDTTGR